MIKFSFFLTFLLGLTCSVCADNPSVDVADSSFVEVAATLPEEVITINKEAPVHPDKPESFKLMAHKAVYEVKLNPLKKVKDPTIKDIKGIGTIELIKTKEGWSYKQNLEVHIFYNDGTTKTVEKNVATWESPTAVSFHIENIDDTTNETSILQGGAELKNGNWEVFFQKPKMDGFTFGYPMDFPIGHLEKILKFIENNQTVEGKKVLSDQVVFDPTYEVPEPNRIDSVIVPCKTENVHITKDLLPSTKLWRVKEAIYEIRSQNLESDYEGNNVEIFSTGVINSMETTWGNGIAVILILKELTVYE